MFPVAKLVDSPSFQSPTQSCRRAAREKEKVGVTGRLSIGPRDVLSSFRPPEPTTESWSFLLHVPHSHSQYNIHLRNNPPRYRFPFVTEDYRTRSLPVLRVGHSAAGWLAPDAQACDIDVGRLHNSSLTMP